MPILNQRNEFLNRSQLAKESDMCWNLLDLNFKRLGEFHLHLVSSWAQFKIIEFQALSEAFDQGVRILIFDKLVNHMIENQ